GSVTKVFTAILLAGMVEEGLVALEDPVQRYLPAGVELPVRGRPITLAAGAGALRSTVADLLAFLRVQLGEGDRALARAAALTHAPRWRHRGGSAVGLGWSRLPLPGAEHELLLHNGGTGGFRSFV